VGPPQSGIGKTEGEPAGGEVQNSSNQICTPRIRGSESPPQGKPSAGKFSHQFSPALSEGERNRMKSLCPSQILLVPGPGKLFSGRGHLGVLNPANSSASKGSQTNKVPFHLTLRRTTTREDPKTIGSARARVLIRTRQLLHQAQPSPRKRLLAERALPVHERSNKTRYMIGPHVGRISARIKSLVKGTGKYL